MSWIELRKSSLEWSIKFTTKGIAAQLGLLAFNAAGMAWNGWWAYKEPHFVYGFGLGAFTANFLWTTSMCLKWWSDVRADYRELKYLLELEAKEHINDDRKDYKEAKERYERMSLLLAQQRADELGVGIKSTDQLDGNRRNEPNCVGEVCTQADVRNCH